MPEGRCRYSTRLGPMSNAIRFEDASYLTGLTSSQLRPPDGDAPPHCRLGRVHPLPRLHPQVGRPWQGHAIRRGDTRIPIHCNVMRGRRRTAATAPCPLPFEPDHLFEVYAALRYHASGPARTWRHRLNSAIVEPVPPDLRGYLFLSQRAKRPATTPQRAPTAVADDAHCGGNYVRQSTLNIYEPMHST